MSNVGQIPQLRFPEFTGEWQEKRLGEIGKFYRGLSYDKSNVGLSGNLVLRSGNIQGGQLILDQDLQFVNKAIGKDQNLSKGDIVICMANGSKKLVGKAAIYKGQYSGSITVGAFCSIFRSNNTLAEYLLQTHQYKKYLNMLLAGTNINNLKSSDLEKLKFILPSNEEEQQKIAAFLAAVDKRVALLERKVQQLEAYKCGVMQQLFSQQLRFTRPDGSHFPVWQEKRLREITVNKPSTITAGQLSDNFEGYAVYGASGIAGYVKSFQHEQPYTAVVKDGAGAGRLLWCEGETSVLSTLTVLLPRQGIDAGYLHYVLQGIDFPKYITGSTIPHVYYRDFSKAKLKVSVFEEQQKIAAFLSALDEKIALTRRQLDKAKQFKKGLLQRMFV